MVAIGWTRQEENLGGMPRSFLHFGSSMRDYKLSKRAPIQSIRLSESNKHIRYTLTIGTREPDRHYAHAPSETP
jgi:hypothetical protein